MLRFRTKLRPSTALIDMTPLVDVIFLMLIFFIITSDILPLKSLRIESPRIERDSLPLTTQLLVVVDAQNVIYVGSRKSIVDMGSLQDTLRSEIEHMRKQHGSADPTIVVSVDRRVDYGTFLRLFSLIQEDGHRMRLVYQPDEDSSSEYF